MNIIDYIRWRGELTFRASPFNEVDNLIFSCLVYLDFSFLDPKTPVSLKKAAEMYFSRNEELEEDRKSLNYYRQQLLKTAAGSDRFQYVKISHYVREVSLEEEKQFAAATFRLPTGDYFIAFQGTDSSVVGWKENFNMSYTCPVASQVRALTYLKRFSNTTRRPFYVGGHSKGGNLAVYASAMLMDRDRIITIYNNDGPGFPEEFTSDAPYQKIHDKILTFIPQKSIVGRLMNNDSDIIIINSKATDALWQHDIFSWEIDVTRMSRAEETSIVGDYYHEVLDNWYHKMTNEEKLTFINAVYETIQELGIKSTNEITGHKVTVLRKMAPKLAGFDDETRKTALNVMAALLKSNAKAFYNVYIDKMLDTIK